MQSLRCLYHVTPTCANHFPVKHRHLATVFIAIPKVCLSYSPLERRNSRFISPIQIPRNSFNSPPLQFPMGSKEKSSKVPCIPDEAKKILIRLAAEWSDIVDPKALQVIPLKGAMTNEVYQIKWLTNSNLDDSLPRSRKVLVRIYGAGVEIFFDRENEIRTFEFMSKQGQGPRLLGRFSNGRVEEFIRARVHVHLFLSLFFFFSPSRCLYVFACLCVEFHFRFFVYSVLVEILLLKLQ